MKNPGKEEVTMKKHVFLPALRRMFQSFYLFFIIVALVGTTAHLTVGMAEGASPWEAILNAINATDSKIDSIKDMVSGLQLSMNVNERFCATGFPAQCNDSGHTFAAAASDNHNPVLITVLVTRMDGSQVDGIPSANFLFDQSVGPGPGIKRCGDPQDLVGCGPFTSSYFVYVGNGLYAFVVHPSVSGFNWKAAQYGFVLTVTGNDGNVGRALGKIMIDQ